MVAKCKMTSCVLLHLRWLGFCCQSLFEAERDCKSKPAEWSHVRIIVVV